MSHGPAEYEEAQVNDLMNVVCNNVNGEYVYLLQLGGGEGEGVIGSENQDVHYVILKTDHAEGLEATAQIHTDGTVEYFHTHNGPETTNPEYEEDQEEIFGGVNEEQTETSETYAEHQQADEQVSAATNLLEFHNQQHGATSESELVDTLEENEEQKPENDDLMRLLANTPLKNERADGNTGELHAKPFPKRTYGRNPTELKTEIKIEGTNNGDLERQSSGGELRMIHPSRRKRRAIVDQVKVISNSEFKRQLQDTSDIRGKLELAPRTKKAMTHLAFSGVGKYFAYPGRRVHGMPLAQLFYTRLKVNVEPVPDPQQEPLKPLDPDLRTPGHSDPDLVNPPPLEQYGSHECVETVLRKTVDSFDSMIKRMNTDKRRQKERKLKANAAS